MITKITQRTFAHPERSWRRNRSEKTVISSQNQMIQAMKSSTSQKKLPNVYVAITATLSLRSLFEPR